MMRARYDMQTRWPKQWTAIWAAALLCAAAGCSSCTTSSAPASTEPATAASARAEADNAQSPTGASAPEAPAEQGPVVRIETSMGTIRVQLDSGRAPKTVENFLSYIEKDFYEGTIFHRVIDDFMIQGGGFEPGMVRKPTAPPIKLEVHPALRHVDGAIAMARTNDPNSATAQFYITDGPQPYLDGQYAAFGTVIEGMNVVREIADVPTGPGDVPRGDVMIERVEVE